MRHREVTASATVDAELRAALLTCWTDVTNAGGAVGFVAPVTAAEVAPVLDALIERVHSGQQVLCLLRVDGALAGFAALAMSASPLRRHWATVLRVQVHPARQGEGLGRVLMEGVHAIARDRGLEFLHLTVRSGYGLEGFYERLGYRVFGRMAGAIRLAPGDDRDEVHLTCRL
ncbi:GNAT family N-acetyltransferase [Blastococcus sp. SYSU D00820]